MSTYQIDQLLFQGTKWLKLMFLPLFGKEELASCWTSTLSWSIPWGYYCKHILGNVPGQDLLDKVSKNSLLHLPDFADIIASQRHLAAEVLRRAGRLWVSTGSWSEDRNYNAESQEQSLERSFSSWEFSSGCNFPSQGSVKCPCIWPKAPFYRN